MTDLIERYLAHVRAAGYSDTTVRARRIMLRVVDAALPDGLDHASVDELEAWLGSPSWSRWTRYTYFEHLVGFYTWAVLRGHLSYSPMEKLTRPRSPRCEPRPASEAELARALRMPRPWRTAVLLAAAQGLRAAEIAGLYREHVSERWLMVERKGEVDQLLPTHAAVWAEVAPLPAGPIMRTGRGHPFSPSYLSVALSRELARAGLTGVTLQRYRHRFATVVLLPVDQGGAGADVRTLQELLGHRHLASTEVYTRVTSSQRRAAIAALPVPGLVVPGI